ncbi:uncharacterized protein LOC128229192 [Mya arenaria]|uniref:uncharacterized protein LOC128229192 n=1 Tax=Mya arenaria TaxID=6604 RepID=UPI0022DF4292|nr:uncharacterized protein LOC128229192 [Mya arenaria]
MDRYTKTEHGSMIVSQNHAMTEVEVQSLDMCKEEIILLIDPYFVSATLCREYPQFEPVHQVIHELELTNDRKDVSEVLISHLPQHICLKDFVFILKECGYTALAAELLRSRLKLDAVKTLKHIHRSTSGQRPWISKMNFVLKNKVDDAMFTNPRLALRQIRDRFILKMQNESDEDRRQFLADKCVAVIGAEIDAIAITFDKGLCEGAVFTEMKSLTHATSNTLLTDGVYLGRLANANAIAGRFNESTHMIKAALCNAFSIGPCFELVFMIYNAVQVMLYSFENSPTAENRRALLLFGNIGLQYAEQEISESKMMWRRSYVLRMVFCLLGLGNKASVIKNCPVDATCIVEAKTLLADIEKNLTGIETRREMLYYVAKARLAELTQQHQDCLDNLRISQNLAIEGHFGELRFISDYLDKVNTQIQRPDIIKWEEREREELGNLNLDETKNYSFLGSQSLETISIRTFDDAETIPKHRLNSQVALSSTSTLAGNSDADSFTKPKCVFSTEHPYPIQEQLHGSYETRIPGDGRESASNTSCQTGERLSSSHEGYQKEGDTSVEHLNVYQSFKDSDEFENMSSLDSDDVICD